MKKRYGFLGTFLVSTLLASVASAGDPLFCENEVGYCEYKYEDGTAAACVCENGNEDAVYGAPLPDGAVEKDINEYCLRALDTICDGENPITGTVEAECENEVVRCDTVAGFDYLYAECDCIEDGRGFSIDGSPTVGLLPDAATMNTVCRSSIQDATVECTGNGDTDDRETDLGAEDSDAADSNDGEEKTDDSAADDSDTDADEDTATGTGKPTDTAGNAEQAASDTSAGCSMAPFHAEASWFSVLYSLIS